MKMKRRNTTTITDTTTNTPIALTALSTTPSTPQLFNNPEFGSVRVLAINDEPWFVGKDVAVALGYADPNKAIAMHVDEDDKLNDKTASSLGQRGGWLINESGLYSLILSSKLKDAKRFKHWVTSEVLPSIRKTGGYVHNEDVFINTYLPFADESTQMLFKTTLHTIQEQNNLIRTQKATITQQQSDLNYKQDVIQNLTNEISLADKRQILNRVMRHNGGQFANRWSVLYREFENKYNMNLSVRLENYNQTHKPKLKNKLDYIDKVLGVIPELYDLAAKLFESDVKELIEEMYETRR